MAFENATGLTPSEVTLGLAGWMLLSAHNAPFALVFMGVLYAAAGSLLGASASYWAALVLFGRLVPAVRTVTTIPAGLSRMPYPQFALLTFCGAYFWCAILIGIGYLLGHEWMLLREEVIAYIEKFAPYGFGGMMLIAAGWLTVRVYQSRGGPRFVFVTTRPNDPYSAGGQDYEK